MLKGDTDTDTDTLISEISIPIPILILFKYRISILMRYRYDTFGQKYRSFDTDTIVSKVSAGLDEFQIYEAVLSKTIHQVCMYAYLSYYIKRYIMPCLLHFIGRKIFP